jgi:hypothetical protein
LLGVFLVLGLACLLDDVVIRDLIWELIEGLTGLFSRQKEKFVQNIAVLGELWRVKVSVSSTKKEAKVMRSSKPKL